MINIKEIKNDEKVDEWISCYTSENTIYGYLSALKKYVCMTQKTPSELIDEAIDESGEIIPKRNYLKYMDKFYLYLKNGGENQKPMAEKSVNKNMKAIISFYHHHRIEIINPRLINGAKTKNDDVPTVDQIRDALNIATPMIKTYILIATSSGLSVSDIIRLRVKDVQNIDENEITSLKLKRHKTKIDFYTFFSPEATKAIKQYISIRNGIGTNGEDWRIKHRINSDEDYLFIKENIRDEYLDLLKKDYRVAEEYRRMTEFTFQDNFRDLVKKLNMETGKGEYNTIRTHNFRKYFITTLTDLGMGIGDVHFLAGKSLPAGFTPYHKPNGFRTDSIDHWKDRYIDCLNHLMFNEKINDITKDKYKKLEAEFINFRHKSDIKMIEIELNTKIQPNQMKIQQIKDQIKEYEQYIHAGQKPDERPMSRGKIQYLTKPDIDLYKMKIKTFNGEIKILEYEINQIKDEYQTKIEELKKSFSEK